MNPKLLYWFFAYAIMLLALVIALKGYLQIRRGDLVRHYKLMVRATQLILFFVGTYVLKVIFLGREDKSDWDLFYLIVLYIHETFILVMLITGTCAHLVARKLKPTLELADPPSEILALRGKHAKFGRACLITAMSAICTASIVLYGMVQRAG